MTPATDWPVTYCTRALVERYRPATGRQEPDLDPHPVQVAKGRGGQAMAVTVVVAGMAAASDMCKHGVSESVANVADAASVAQCGEFADGLGRCHAGYR